MESLSGIISDRLRALFGSDVSKWPASRKSNMTRKADVKPSSFTGTEMGRKKQRKAKKEK